MGQKVLYIFSVFLISCSAQISGDEPVLSEVPLIHIYTNTPLEYISKTQYTDGTIQIESDEPYLCLESSSVKLRGRGNTTWSFPKKPFQIKFSEPKELLGMSSARKWIFLAHYSDKSLLRTETAFELSRRSEINWTSNSRFVELYLNAEYLGVYQLVEKIEAVTNRVNDGEGFLLECNRENRIGDDDVYFESDFHFYTIKEPEVSFGDPQFNLIKNYIKKAEEVLFGTDFQDTLFGYRKYIDTESFVDWYIIHEITQNSESAWGTSGYMNYVPGEKIKMGPIWDFDLSLGNTYGISTDGFIIKGAGWYAQLFQDSSFVHQVKQRYTYFYSLKDEILEKVASNAYLLDKPQERNFIKWPILGVWVWPNAVTFNEYNHEVAYLKDWCSERMDWLNQAIDDL